jgi:hypothetical protein
MVRREQGEKVNKTSPQPIKAGYGGAPVIPSMWEAYMRGWQSRPALGETLLEK